MAFIIIAIFYYMIGVIFVSTIVAGSYESKGKIYIWITNRKNDPKTFWYLVLVLICVMLIWPYMLWLSFAEEFRKVKKARKERMLRQE